MSNKSIKPLGDNLGNPCVTVEGVYLALKSRDYDKKIEQAFSILNQLGKTKVSSVEEINDENKEEILSDIEELLFAGNKSVIKDIPKDIFMEGLRMYIDGYGDSNKEKIVQDCAEGIVKIMSIDTELSLERLSRYEKEAYILSGTLSYSQLHDLFESDETEYTLRKKVLKSSKVVDGLNKDELIGLINLSLDKYNGPEEFRYLNFDSLFCTDIIQARLSIEDLFDFVNKSDISNSQAFDIAISKFLRNHKELEKLNIFSYLEGSQKLDFYAISQILQSKNLYQRLSTQDLVALFTCSNPRINGDFRVVREMAKDEIILERLSEEELVSVLKTPNIDWLVYQELLKSCVAKNKLTDGSLIDVLSYTEFNHGLANHLKAQTSIFLKLSLNVILLLTLKQKLEPKDLYEFISKKEEINGEQINSSLEELLVSEAVSVDLGKLGAFFEKESRLTQEQKRSLMNKAL